MKIQPSPANWRTRVVRDFAASELFDRTFQEGMDLVEATASYLDGAGRHESKLLSRAAALAYAGESMRLTTRLMQLASWLLVQRAVREGDMEASDACHERYRLRGEALTVVDGDDRQTVPEGLHDLVVRAGRLYERVMHLDKRMYVEQAPDRATHPVLTQIERLQVAFSRA